MPAIFRYNARLSPFFAAARRRRATMPVILRDRSVRAIARSRARSRFLSLPLLVDVRRPKRHATPVSSSLSLCSYAIFHACLRPGVIRCRRVAVLRHKTCAIILRLC